MTNKKTFTLIMPSTLALKTRTKKVLFISNLLAREIGFEGSKTIRESATNTQNVTQHSQKLKLKTLISIRLMIKC